MGFNWAFKGLNRKVHLELWSNYLGPSSTETKMVPEKSKYEAQDNLNIKHLPITHKILDTYNNKNPNMRLRITSI